jgi:hypothetical protein
MLGSDMLPPDLSVPEASPPAQPDVVALAKDVETLKSKWEKENEGLGAWIKKWGAIIGLMAGLIALPKGAYDLYGVMVNKPSTTAMRGLPIVMRYEAATEKIYFSFNTSIHNTGTADDTISQVWATFRSPASTDTSPTSSEIPAVTFDSSKFQISEKADKVPLPFTIAKNTSRDFAFAIESGLESKSIPNDQGMWVLEVAMEGQNRNTPITLRYSLFLPASDVDEMKKSGIVLRFKNAD